MRRIRHRLQTERVEALRDDAGVYQFEEPVDERWQYNFEHLLTSHRGHMCEIREAFERAWVRAMKTGGQQRGAA